MFQQAETKKTPVKKAEDKRPRTPNVDKLIARTEREIARVEAKLAECDALSEENATDYQKLMEIEEQKTAPANGRFFRPVSPCWPF